MKFHLIARFPALQGIEVVLEYLGVGDVGYVSCWMPDANGSANLAVSLSHLYLLKVGCHCWAEVGCHPLDTFTCWVIWHWGSEVGCHPLAAVTYWRSDATGGPKLVPPFSCLYMLRLDATGRPKLASTFSHLATFSYWWSDDTGDPKLVATYSCLYLSRPCWRIW